MTDTSRNLSREAWPADFMIRIRDYQDRIIAGDLEIIQSTETTSFQGLANLLAIMQDRLDQFGFPQASMALRNWDFKGHNGRPESLEPGVTRPPSPAARPSHATQQPPAANPALASFMLRVQFRQNASWQGSIAWLEAGSTAAFRSVLELAGLIEQAVQQVATPAQALPTARPEHRWKSRESVS